MASPSLQYFLVTLSILCFFNITPTVLSTSRRALDNHPKAPIHTGFKIALKHVDHGTNFTKFERFQRAIKRGKHRLQRLNAMSTSLPATTSSTSEQVSAQVHPGNGEFLMQVAIGTPPTSYNAIMDTGSDLIWTQCQPCDDCFDQSTPIFDPKNSSSFKNLPCSSHLCEALPMSSCEDKACEYMYSYGDYSSTQGVMGTETFTFGADNPVSVPSIGFGCGEDNQGSGFDQGAGLIGLGRGPLSLLSQMDEPKFSYCLTSIDGSGSSTLLMGSKANITTTEKVSGSVITTSLVQSSTQKSFYYLKLEGISVGGKRLPIKQSTFSLSDDGSGGLIIDSGTTISYIEESAYDLLKDEFTAQTKLKTTDASDTTGLDLCFELPAGGNDVEVPKLVFHFDGGDLELPSENYMIGDSSMKVACLAMGSSSGMSILGNVQQQNMLVLYDTGNEKLSFIPTKCDDHL